MAAAGSAVGLGNIWRFPYLAAKDGGGLFLVIYIILAVTFGFALLTTEISIGRKTKQSPLTAYKNVKKGWGWIGILSCVIPFIVLPYYCTIGGWVLKYFVAFVTGHGREAAEDGYFSSFITGHTEPVVYMIIFTIFCAAVIFMGVSGGIENISKVLMPMLIFMILCIALFSLTVSKADDTGSIVTGIDGLKVYLIPDLEGITLRRFCYIVLDALGQLFYSLSVAMGIMIAYGSYVPDKANLAKSINQIEIFDTLVAFLAGVMIVPAVYVFMGPDALSKGPSLMFVSLPKVFVAMGKIGNVVGAVFFGMVFFAAVTSGMSLLEAVVASVMDQFGMSRQKGTAIETVISLVIGLLVCLGYNVLYFNIKLPNGDDAQLLDVMDYVSNQVLMPVVTIATCLLVGWVKKPDYVISEVTRNGEKFGRAGLYKIMVRFVAPVLVLFLLMLSVGIL
ncbi:neurotransmitter:Na+ symporter, NSS family [Ruminococcaceae bacterium YRB3002]|nr:neurotransmitter:Na+ symporter, NSS family [Ruminococcaceae bacterium YRB3002]